ncbi:copper chaperone PCu(A)C [Streptomyces actinomycinicus]|uniref:Copper chaperone PCu(A)C n=1 Tax=Streptomyces actinomycinicus TaxID=1695166 RepID=A0A937JQ57_9ACTN|nr:copper chaperone PCu(A)C [Streptomyces actinomycinicus]MBL1083113.1 copper chaperone PCu(A)C [Streptomyces actinomycinicus]
MSEEQGLWRPSGRRVAEALVAALVPVAACGVALGGLTAWVGAGKAGSPPRIAVSSGRVLLPYGDSTQTAAFFDVANAGGADDRLVRVTSTATRGGIALSRHRAAGGGAAAYKADVDSVPVPAGGTLSMSPHGADVTLRAAAGWRAGDLVPFTLHFEHSAPVRTFAVVVRPGDRTR